MVGGGRELLLRIGSWRALGVMGMRVRRRVMLVRGEGRCAVGVGVRRRLVRLGRRVSGIHGAWSPIFFLGPSEGREATSGEMPASEPQQQIQPPRTRLTLVVGLRACVQLARQAMQKACIGRQRRRGSTTRGARCLVSLDRFGRSVGRCSLFSSVDADGYRVEDGAVPVGICRMEKFSGVASAAWLRTSLITVPNVDAAAGDARVQRRHRRQMQRTPAKSR